MDYSDCFQERKRHSVQEKFFCFLCDNQCIQVNRIFIKLFCTTVVISLVLLQSCYPVRRVWSSSWGCLCCLTLLFCQVQCKFTSPLVAFLYGTLSVLLFSGMPNFSIYISYYFRSSFITPILNGFFFPSLSLVIFMLPQCLNSLELVSASLFRVCTCFHISPLSVCLPTSYLVEILVYLSTFSYISC